MQHVEIGIVGILHNFSQLLLNFSAQILHFWPFDAVIAQQLNSLSEGELENWNAALEGSEFELLVNGLKFPGVALLDAVEDEGEELSEEV